MLVAYIVQIAVVLITCVLWHCLQDWAKCGVFVHYKICKRSENATIQAEKIRTKLSKSRMYESFVKALAEFQKAQVFFLMAVLVAGLIAWFNPTVLANDGIGEDVDKHDQQRAKATLSKNVNILIDLAYAGSFPIVLGLMNLRKAGKRDTYHLVISSFPLILALIILIATRGEADAKPQDTVTPSGGPDSCAKVKPTDYCFPSTYTPSLLATIGGWPIFICFLVYTCIVLERFKLFKDRNKAPAPQRTLNDHESSLARVWRTFIDHTAYRQNVFEALRDWMLRRQRFWVRYGRLVHDRRGLRWLASLNLDTGETLIHIVGKATALAAEIVLCGFNIALLHEYARIISPKEYRVSDFQFWTLGQVIAVTVWFPVLVEFLWDCYGMSSNKPLQKSKPLPSLEA